MDAGDESVEEIDAPPIADGLRYLILDASSWMFTDTVGLRTIKEVRFTNNHLWRVFFVNYPINDIFLDLSLY